MTIYGYIFLESLDFHKIYVLGHRRENDVLLVKEEIEIGFEFIIKQKKTMTV